MAKITYLDKVALNENTDIPDNNKVKANDMNEIKQVVNANYDDVGNIADLNTEDISNIVNAINEVNDKLNYSTEEQVIGKWTNGKPLYRKVYTSYNVSEESTVDVYTIDIDITKDIHNSYGKIFAGDYKVNIGTGDAGFGVISNVQQNSSGQIYISRTHGSFGQINGLEITLEYTKTTD